MNDKQCQNTINEIFMEIFGQKCPVKIEELLSECAFDIKLPIKVIDAVTGDETWASSINSNKYISQTNMKKYDEYRGWMRPKKEISSIDDIIKNWDKINYTTTERIYDSINVSKSDTIYNCENIYRSQDCRSCKNVIFTDGCANSDYIIGCQRSSDCNYSIRVSDSNSCSSSLYVLLKLVIHFLYKTQILFMSVCFALIFQIEGIALQICNLIKMSIWQLKKR